MQIRPLAKHDVPALLALVETIREVDGLSLKLELASATAGTNLASLSAWEDGALVGFLGLYAYGFGPQVELCGMVAPPARRRGTATALLEAGLEIAEREGRSDRLLIVPRASVGGQALAARRDGVIDHTEYTMVLSTPSVEAASGVGAVRLGRARDEDRAALTQILTAGFGPVPSGMLERLHTPAMETVTVVRDGAVIGTARLSLHDGGAGSIHAFAIAPEHRGRGHGGAALAAMIARLAARGAASVRLEVAVENDRALSLYRRAGFEPVSTEDYFRLPAPSVKG